MSRSVREIDDEPHEGVTNYNATLTPMSFDTLSLLADRTEAIHDLQDRFGKPLTRNISTVIELEGEQHLELPPVTAHRLSFP